MEQAPLDGIPAPEKPTLRGRFSALAVKTVHPFMAQKDIRHYLNGVNVRLMSSASGVMLVATDGNRFIVMRDPNGTLDKPVVLRIDKDALKHMGDPKTTLDLMSNGEVLISDSNNIELFIQPGQSIIVDGAAQFPRIENIISLAGYSEGIRGQVSPAYLAEVLTVGEAFGGVQFFTRDPDSPILFVLSGMGDLQCFGGVMPRRDPFESLPSWFPMRTEPSTLGDV